MQLGTPGSISSGTFSANKQNLNSLGTQILNGTPENYAAVSLFADNKDSSMLYVQVESGPNSNLIIEPNSNSQGLELDVNEALPPTATISYWEVSTNANIPAGPWDLDVEVAEKKGSGSTKKGTWKFTKGRS